MRKAPRPQHPGFNPPRGSSPRGTTKRPPRNDRGGWFQSAPGFITPGNVRPSPTWTRTATVSIRPGVHHPGERFFTMRPPVASAVSIRPGVHHPGEHCRRRFTSAERTGFNPPRGSSPRGTAPARTSCSGSASFNPPRGSSPRGTVERELVHPRAEVSIRPGVHHPGEQLDAAIGTRGDKVAVSIRPGVHHPGERREGRGRRLPGRVSIRPGVHHPGEPPPPRTGPGASTFQSAPGFITPGNPRRRPRRRLRRRFNPPRGSSPRGTPARARWPTGWRVSIRPGVHHPGERRRPATESRAAYSFNPPRGSSPRGTQQDQQEQQGQQGFNPPRGSSPRGTRSVNSPTRWTRGFNPPRGSSPRGTADHRRSLDPGRVSIRPGVHHPGEPRRGRRGAASGTGFNPPRGSSPRGTYHDTARSRAVSSFNPPRGSSPRGTMGRVSCRRVAIVSIRPGVHHPGEPRSRSSSAKTRASFNPPRGSSPRGTGCSPFVIHSTNTFQSAPGFITPGNTWPGDSTRWCTVSIRPGVHHPGERRRRGEYLDMKRRFQSAPGFITPGNAEGRTRRGELGRVSIRPGVHHPGEHQVGRHRRVGQRVSIRPGVHHPGERGPPSRPRSPSGFNPPRGSSPRGTQVRSASSRAPRMFQSAPGFITPGNADPRPGWDALSKVSIRPGVHHPGERISRTVWWMTWSFNPPRGSSPRGTRTPTDRPGSAGGVSIRPGVHHPGEPAASAARCTRVRCFNPPRGSSPRGTRPRTGSGCRQ